MDKKHLGILMITPVFRPEVGGVSTHLDGLIEYLQEKGHKVFVVTFPPPYSKTKTPSFERKKNLTVQRVGWRPASTARCAKENPLFEFICITLSLLMFSLIFVLRHKEEIDVIHGHGIHAAVAAKILKKTFKKKAITTIHSTRVFNFSGKVFETNLIRMILSSSDIILVMANMWKKKLAKIGLDSRRIRIFTHWVDQAIFRPIRKTKCKAELGLENKFVVLFVGRLEITKGVRVLIGAARKLNKTKDLHFAVVGGGPLAYDIILAARASQNITYAGKVNPDNLVTYYNAADVVVVPSFHNEGFCRVVLEALSCGTPVLGSSRGGITEALDKSVGILVEPEVAEISQTILMLYRNPKRLAELSSHCREYSETKFNQRNAEVIENAYRA